MDRHLLNTARILAGVGLAFPLAGFILPGAFTWGFHFLGYLSPAWLVIYCTVSAAGTYLLFRGGTHRALLLKAGSLATEKPVIVVSAAVCLFIASAMLFRVKIPLLGDSFVVLNIFENTLKGLHPLGGLYHSPLSMYYFYFFVSALSAAAYPQAMDAFLAGEILLGAGFVVVIFFTLRNVVSEPRTVVPGLVFVLAAPFMQVFFGYVEVYAVIVVLFGIFLMASILVLDGKAPFPLAAGAFTLMVFAHYLSVIFFPGLLYLAVREYKRRGLRPVVLGILTLVLMTFAAAALEGFHLDRFIPRESYSHFLSPWPVQDGYQAYTLFSLYHILDLVNLFIFLAPGAAILMLVAWRSGGARGLLASVHSRFLALCAVPYMLLVFISKFDLGMAKDWDVAATFFGAVSLMALVAAERILPDIRPAVVSAAAFLTLMTSLPFFALNATAGGSISRVQALTDSRLVARNGVYQTTFHLSMAALYRKDPYDMIRLWREYTNRFPDDPRGFQKLAKSYLELGTGGTAGALETFERWRSLEPENPAVKSDEANYCMGAGVSCFQAGDLERARELFTRALALAPGMAGAYNNIGLIYAARNEYDSAALMYTAAIRADSSYGLAYKNMGSMLIARGSPRQAVPYLEQAARFSPSPAGAFEQLASVYMALGDEPKALQAFRKAASLGSISARQHLAEKGLE